ncbi:putative bifunctional diguanylate cyclase/phosphodiesterase [Paraglaciecola sp.]|uniref:putative bifunctional diguanylate cyclase/phosphodiesterase n=1 Tax=Paraglaciecola sp. TaxID=1920173 RepID=UPI003EF46121
MDAIARTLQLISIQHELSMTIGSDLNLEKMLSLFMQRAQLRLSLSAVSVIHNLSTADESSHGTNHISFSFPKNCDLENDFLLKNAGELFKQKVNTYYQCKLHDYFYYLFVIPNFGILILERKHQAIEATILEALSPLVEKLATSCLACVEHQNLIEEISARKNAEQSLIQQSLLDPLTGLPNRKMFNMSLTQALDRSAQSKHFGAVLFIDLDRFKVINDSFGHSVGDEVLKFIAQRFLKCVTKDDTFARMGGDEFVLLVTNLSQDKSKAVNKAKGIAQELSAQLSKPLYIDENSFSVTISTGISLFPLEEASDLSAQQQCNSLLKNADLAMYRIKHGNRNGYGFFSSEMQAYSDKRTQIEKNLRLAVARNELELFYQPLVNSSAEMIAAEALLRWNSPQLGQVSPAEFIPIAEESGLIIDIGQWVIIEVCKLLQQINTDLNSNKPSYISINVSPRQFSQANFVQHFVSILDEHKINYRHVRIEITEGVAIDNVELAIAKLKMLKEFGIDCMLDDFGSGYSSLSYLNKLPLQAVKIDRSFIKNIESSKYHQLIVNAVCDICDYSQLECIAEGVETQSEAGYLVGKNISSIQGYYFHKPKPQSEFLTLMQ